MIITLVTLNIEVSHNSIYLSYFILFFEIGKHKKYVRFKFQFFFFKN